VLSLWDLFDLHRRTGNHQEACRTAKNASEVYRNLIQDGFLDLKPDFASLLLATANCSLDLNLPNDALAAIVEAVDLYAQLASTADKYRSSQADCLDIAHSCYTRLGSHHKAYQAACKAIRIRQGLDFGQSERANPLLGSSVTNSANSLLKLERFSDARKELTYAVSIYRTLAVRNPETHRPNLAYSLNNLSSCLSKLKEDDEALEAAEEAVKIYRKLASNSSDNIHLERLATCLYNLAHCHSVLQGYTAGLQSAEDAVRIYSRLCATGSRLRPRLEQSQRYYNELKENISHKSRSYRK
jgi:tetratricopeptide (TPR) repeat protein